MLSTWLSNVFQHILQTRYRFMGSIDGAQSFEILPVTINNILFDPIAALKTWILFQVSTSLSESSAPYMR